MNPNIYNTHIHTHVQSLVSILKGRVKNIVLPSCFKKRQPYVLTTFCSVLITTFWLQLYIKLRWTIKKY